MIGGCWCLGCVAPSSVSRFTRATFSRVALMRAINREKGHVKPLSLELLLMFGTKQKLHRPTTDLCRGEPPCSPGQRSNDNCIQTKRFSSRSANNKPRLELGKPQHLERNDLFHPQVPYH